MPAPNMDTITATLEKSLQDLSLNNQNSSNSSGGMVEPPCAGNKSSASDSMEDHDQSNDSSVQVELHSETPLPQFWEQWLDQKTGEICYINWRTGLRYDEDPRTNPHITADHFYFYPEDEEDIDDDDDDDDDDDSYYSYDIEDSSSEESSVSLSLFDWLKFNNNNSNLEENKESSDGGGGGDEEQVLVVAGCKNCLMYFMVPKQVNDCSKCHGQLLHFDRSSEDGKP